MIYHVTAQKIKKSLMENFIFCAVYDLQTYIKQSASYVTIKQIFKFSHQLLISFK